MTTQEQKALELALEEFTRLRGFHAFHNKSCEAVITAIKEALAQQPQNEVRGLSHSNEQVEPVAVPQFRIQGSTDWYDGYPDYLDGADVYETRILYTHPPVPTAQPKLQTCNCRWDGEVQVQQCTLHESHVDAVHEWAERAKTAEAKLKAQPKEPEQEPKKGECTWCGGDCPQFECDTHSTWMNEPVIRRDLPPQPKEPEQEPVAFYRCNGCGHEYQQMHPTSCDCMKGSSFEQVNYYTTPPQRTWVGLTDEEINIQHIFMSRHKMVRYFESKLKEKNTK